MIIHLIVVVVCVQLAWLKKTHFSVGPLMLLALVTLVDGLLGVFPLNSDQKNLWTLSIVFLCLIGSLMMAGVYLFLRHFGQNPSLQIDSSDEKGIFK